MVSAAVTVQVASVSPLTVLESGATTPVPAVNKTSFTLHHNDMVVVVFVAKPTASYYVLFPA